MERIRRSIGGLVEPVLRAPDVALYCAAVYMYFAVNIAVTMHIAWDLAVVPVAMAPHINMIGLVLVVLLTLGVLRATVVAGTGSWRAWVSTFGKVRSARSLLFYVADRRCPASGSQQVMMTVLPPRLPEI